MRKMVTAVTIIPLLYGIRRRDRFVRLPPVHLLVRLAKWAETSLYHFDKPVGQPFLFCAGVRADFAVEAHLRHFPIFFSNGFHGISPVDVTYPVHSVRFCRIILNIHVRKFDDEFFKIGLTLFQGSPLNPPRGDFLVEYRGLLLQFGLFSK